MPAVGLEPEVSQQLDKSRGMSFAKSSRERK
jgi:hypothetical protein